MMLYTRPYLSLKGNFLLGGYRAIDTWFSIHDDIGGVVASSANCRTLAFSKENTLLKFKQDFDL